MNYNARANAEELRSLAAGSIGVNLTAIGAAPANPAFNILIFNGTNEIITFGWSQADGLLDRIALPAGGGYTLDCQTNKKGADGDLNYPAGRTIYAKQNGIPASGSVYVTYFYGGK